MVWVVILRIDLLVRLDIMKRLRLSGGVMKFIFNVVIIMIQNWILFMLMLLVRGFRIGVRIMIFGVVFMMYFVVIRMRIIIVIRIIGLFEIEVSVQMKFCGILRMVSVCVSGSENVMIGMMMLLILVELISMVGKLESFSVFRIKFMIIVMIMVMVLVLVGVSWLEKMLQKMIFGMIKVYQLDFSVLLKLVVYLEKVIRLLFLQVQMWFIMMLVIRIDIRMVMFGIMVVRNRVEVEMLRIRLMMMQVIDGGIRMLVQVLVVISVQVQGCGQLFFISWLMVMWLMVVVLVVFELEIVVNML